MKNLVFVLASLAVLSQVKAETPEEVARRQARSVHLWYAPVEKDAASVVGTVKVTETQPGSYFMIVGWDCGYSGIQDFRGAHWAIFSVWDAVDFEACKSLSDAEREQLRAKIHYSAPDVNVARFGGEGTGVRTMMKYDWKLNEPVRLRVDSEPIDGNRTAYTCYLHNFADGSWKKLATISTSNHGGPCKRLNGIYSFIEDFARNYKSATVSRRAEFFDFATRAVGAEQWRPATMAYFGGDHNPSLAVDAGRVEGHPGAFFLQTGGATTNAHTKVMSVIR